MLSHLCVNRSVDRGPALKDLICQPVQYALSRLFQLQCLVHSATILVVLASS